MSTEQEQKNENELVEKAKNWVGVLAVFGLMYWFIKTMVELWRTDKRTFFTLVIGGICLYCVFEYAYWIQNFFVWIGLFDDSQWIWPDGKSVYHPIEDVPSLWK